MLIGQYLVCLYYVLYTYYVLCGAYSGAWSGQTLTLLPSKCISMPVHELRAECWRRDALMCWERMNGQPVFGPMPVALRFCANEPMDPRTDWR